MTRFARAKGSKASNERKEESPTPWHVMRQQFLDQTGKNSLQKNECSVKSIKNDVFSSSESKQEEEVWSDFCKINENNHEKSSKDFKHSKNRNECKLHKEDKKKITFKSKHSGNTVNDFCNNVDKMKHRSFSMTEVVPKLKQNKKDTNYRKRGENCIKKKQLNVSKQYENKKCENKHLGKQNCFNSTTSCLKKNDTKLGRSVLNHSFVESSDNIETELDQAKHESSKYNDRSNQKNVIKCSNKTFPNKAFTIIANGREIKVVNFEGFFIKKDDATALKKLKKKLRAQNISKEQIKVIMKLQRRKAEKALAREKNNVCFHCRKFGHNFTDCPDIDDSEMSKAGMCFKCGSMEHSYFQCKVLQSQDFRYAVCFVCKEQGHIARQCPLNPQGQYPKGGSCHVCGEVTHLRKDCPKAVDKKPNNTFTVEQLRSDQVEDLSETSVPSKKVNKRKNKVVKF